VISGKNAWAVLEAEATKLKSLTFDELDKINSELPVSIDVLMSKWRGLFRQRISVELVAYTEKGTHTPDIVQFVYFERLKSGRLLCG